jgi:prepilin-type N-terminal cleavage/methylation domain-containing protein
MKLRSGKGFTLIELLIVVAVIGTVAAIAVPGLLRARMAGNEASGIGSLRAINSGEAAFASSCGQGGYATSLSQLFAPAPTRDQGFISPDLAIDTSTKSGYVIVLSQGRSSVVVLAQAETCNDTGDALATYFAQADPIEFERTGLRHFGTDERGSIFQDTSDTALTADTLLTAGTVTPLQ